MQVSDSQNVSLIFISNVNLMTLRLGGEKQDYKSQELRQKQTNYQTKRAGNK
jgi:hypothetical protein